MIISSKNSNASKNRQGVRMQARNLKKKNIKKEKTTKPKTEKLNLNDLVIKKKEKKKWKIGHIHKKKT